MSESPPEAVPPYNRLITVIQVACFISMSTACLIIGRSYDLFIPLWRDMLSFLMGAHGDISARDAPLPSIIADSMAVAILTIPVMAFGTLLAAVMGGLKSEHVEKPLFHVCAEKKAPGRGASLFLAIHKIACVVLLEEFYARWLFIGLLTQIPWLSGPSAFYLLFLAGNTLWAAVHIGNYEKGQRHFSVTIPVFCSGFVDAVMFLRYGLLGAFISHLVWDLIIMLPKWIGQTLRKKPLTL